MPANALGIDDATLRQVREFQVLQEEIDEFVAREGEAEIVLPFTVGAAFGAATAGAALWAGDCVAFDILLVAWQQVVTQATRGTAMERRFVHALCGECDLARLISILDAPARRAFVHRLADQ